MFVVVRDPKVGQHTHEERAQLRSLPLLRELGFTRYLHRSMWDNGFRMVEYEYLNSDGLDTSGDLFPLVHLVSQRGIQETPVERHGIERSGEQHVMKELLQTRSGEDIYVVVTDAVAPRAPAISRQRPVTDEYGPVTTVNYEQFVDDYVQKTLDSALPMTATRNYFFHKVSDYHRRVGAPADTLEELFDYEKAPLESPVWEPLYYFVNHDLKAVLERYTERIRETLRSWLERGDVTRIANEMDAMLTQCEFRADQLDDQRKRNTEYYDDV
jgi:hypothetical protein